MAVVTAVVATCMVVTVMAGMVTRIVVTVGQAMLKNPKQEAPAQWLTPGLLGFGKTADLCRCQRSILPKITLHYCDV